MNAPLRQLPLARAYEIAGKLMELLRHAGARDARITGEVRRGRPFIDEIEILVRGLSPLALARALEPVSRGVQAERASGVERLSIAEGGSVCVRIVDEDWLAELIERTGDEAHVRLLHEQARAAGHSVKTLAERAQNEAEFYKLIDLPYVAPELRMGAHTGQDDELVTTVDVRGTFHCHTDWSDGRGSLLETVKAAGDSGFLYVGISDHSRSDAHGLDETRLRAQCAAIAQARRDMPDIVVLHGIEVDILDDGSLDLPDASLADLDFVIASVHSNHKLPVEQMTERVLKAVSHPLVTFLGHPTGRYVFPGRVYDGYMFDIDRVCRAAIDNEVCFELNGSPRRLDPPRPLLEELAARGARFVINPDAHSPWRICDTHLGVMLARNAGLCRSQILNASHPDEVLAGLRERRDRGAARLGLVRGIGILDSGV